jgi:hypothetical protein
MDDATQQWLLSQLGTQTDLADLDTRYARLHNARAVALEVLRERRADLLTNPLVLGVANVVNVSYAANITALERQIAELEDPSAPPAPDEPGYGDPAGQVTTIHLRARPRR